uniref:Transforming growth factor alpha n=1 Tax=Nothoprocta perdicaria TaxID=30464 RepID=A0A8C6ZI41_NOTPE
ALTRLSHVSAGVFVAVCHALENTTAALSGPPVAAAVRSHFNDCPDSHSQFCFHGTCRFLIQEDKPGALCLLGTHADLLAVVAANQKKQTITALVVVSVVASAVLIAVCVLIHCCRLRKPCEWCRAAPGRHDKPGGLLKGGASCCHAETGRSSAAARRPAPRLPGITALLCFPAAV